MPPGRGTPIVAIALAAVLGGVVWVARGPAPPAKVTADHFSAVSAYDALKSVLGGDTPHPIGGPAHDGVRDRIAARLRSLGYLVQIQNVFACDGYNTCGNVSNVIARRPGDPARPGVVLTAHYDSVPAGPGASDDGIGVASILEIARVVRQEPFRNPPIFLIDDGEEAGLLGAEGFVADPGLRASAGCIINVEARGTRGPSSLFETSRNNRWLVSGAIAAQPRPLTTSLFATIYDLLPNDTDLTVFKRVGLQGVNFGIIGNVAAYHTPLDDLQHVSLHSLQHHGINALSILRTLGNGSLETSDQNAVWFDVLSLFVVRWPQRATIWIAIVSTIALLVAMLLLRREGRATIGEIAIGIVSFLLSLAATAVVAFIVSWLGRLRADGATWVAHPGALIVASWITGMLAPLAIFSAFARRWRGEGLQLGCALAWNIIAIALAAILPGVSYLFVAPAVALSIWSLLRAFGIAFSGDISIPAVVAAIVFFPSGILFHDALGAPALIVIALLIGLVATTFAAITHPLSPRFAIVASIAIVACIVISLAEPPFDGENPRRVNVLYVTDGRSARWAVNKPTAEMRDVASFQPDIELYPWVRAAQSATAPHAALPAVQVNATRISSNVVLWTLHSQRSSPRVALLFRVPGDISLRINGVTPPPLARRTSRDVSGWRRIVVRGSDATIELTTHTAEPVNFVALDYTYDLPPFASQLVAARNASTAVASDDGDLTVTMQKGQI